MKEKAPSWTYDGVSGKKEVWSPVVRKPLGLALCQKNRIFATSYSKD